MASIAVVQQASNSVVQIDTVVVFGDSLSDIGAKWNTWTGLAAKWSGQMVVSPTGRFSDCRNWADFMIEEARVPSLVSISAKKSIENSAKHRSLSGGSWVFRPEYWDYKNFRYVNYAEGGACGDTPASLGYALGTFNDQVDRFKQECAQLAPKETLGNVLFIIWFGANDLYTAGRPASGMSAVAINVAQTQREALREIVKGKAGEVRFVFVDLARPLASVRYKLRLKNARANLKKAIAQQLQEPFREGYEPIPSSSSYWRRYGKMAGYASLAKEQGIAGEELKALEDQMREIENLEIGVHNYNANLAMLTGNNGDQLVKISSCLTEETVRALVHGNFRLKKGAAPKKADFVSALKYKQDLLENEVHVTTIDQAHPSDQLYRLIWQEIHNGITKARCTFGGLAGLTTQPVLSALAGLQWQ